MNIKPASNKPPYEQPRDSIYHNPITRLFHLTDKDGWTVQQFTVRADAETYRDRNRRKDGSYPDRA